MELHTYLKHRADTQDVVYETRQEQKEDMALRYKRGVKQFVPCSGYSADASDPLLPRQQTIRSPRRRARLYLRPPKPPENDKALLTR